MKRERLSQIEPTRRLLVLLVPHAARSLAPRLLAGVAVSALSLALLSPSQIARAQTPAPGQAQPEPAAAVPPVPAPQDRPYPGTIKLRIDATDVARHIFTGHETVPVSGAGDHVLLFPQWLPGDHSPTGELDKFGSLVITAGGKTIPWTRDTVNVWAFHVPVPDGVSSLELSFQYFSPVSPNEGRVVMTPDMLDVQWNSMVLYPAGYFSRGITVQADMTLPAGWKFGTGLDVQSQDGATTMFKPVGLNTLIDNPVYAGRNFLREDLDPTGKVPVHLDIVADSPDDLAVTPAQLAVHRNLVQQAYKLFGSHHYDHYDFLLSLSDEMGGEGLEHHRSSENGVGRDYFTEWDKMFAERDLLAHEYTHSWNGKFRRPADLWQPNFNTPERDSLLWVYEGQTQYWGKMLAARSGLISKADTLDGIALTAANYSTGVGRTWRNLEDTTNDPVIAQRRPIPWRSWQRSEDYYEEGALVWLEIDTKIRQLTNGKKSLDDFARAFFGVHDGSYVTKPYVFDDVVHALNGVVPYDWATLLRTRLDATGPVAPLNGITQGGYKLVYNDKESAFLKSAEREREMSVFDWSLGFSLHKNGVLRGVVFGGPAFKAGLTVGTTIVAVNGVEFSVDDLKQAIKDSTSATAPVSLLVKDGTHFRTVQIDYHGGARYPHLERVPGTPDYLDAIVSPKH